MPMPEQRKFDLVKHYLGEALVKYSLNISIPFVDFTDNQIQALETLYNTIKQARHAFIQQDGFGDWFLLNIAQHQHIFAECRVLCGGEIPDIQVPADPLLNFMLKFAVKMYPLLLLKPAMNSLPGQMYFSRLYTISDINNFVNIFRQDVLNNLTNKDSNDMAYALDFMASNGISINLQVSILYINIIHKCFQNCCCKMKYDFDSLIHEIKESIVKLRSLANGKESVFSIFSGVSGLTIQGIDKMELAGCNIWPVASSYIPEKNIELVRSTLDGNLSGAIIEIAFRIKVIKNTPSQGGSCFMSQQLHSYEKKCLELLKFAICFGLDKDYAFISKFSENGFPLAPAGSCSYDPHKFPKKLTMITGQEDITKVTEWYNKLLSISNNQDIGHIKIPLDRLNYAIHERNNPVDGFVDALIAWEALFSGTPETIFRVTGTITKFLNPDNKKDFLKDLKRIYAERSAIVHGGKKIDANEAEQLRLKAVQIGLECLKRLIWIEEYRPLLRMTSGERCDAIMVYDTHLLPQPSAQLPLVQSSSISSQPSGSQPSPTLLPPFTQSKSSGAQMGESDRNHPVEETQKKIQIICDLYDRINPQKHLMKNGDIDYFKKLKDRINRFRRCLKEKGNMESMRKLSISLQELEEIENRLKNIEVNIQATTQAIPKKKPEVMPLASPPPITTPQFISSSTRSPSPTELIFRKSNDFPVCSNQPPSPSSNGDQNRNSESAAPKSTPSPHLSNSNSSND